MPDPVPTQRAFIHTSRGEENELQSKHDLRSHGIQQMRSLDPEELAVKSTRVIANLRTVLEFANAKGIFTCLSYNNEVDTWELADELASTPGKKVYVPRALFGEVQLHVVRYPCRMEALKMGLRQPAADATRVPPEDVDRAIDVALILGVLYDRNRGYRLGYGKGFFDRFLAGRRFPVIALALEQQLAENLPVEPHDVPMDVIVTEERVYRFGEE
ncbi:MAG: 5-formyltetrahydrofolate cyclo-ligase [Armatimonadetes bacterium CG_4_8_14_3_um_filter_58_9]|nr:MAG: 5-formyltetrahydrofolate cyclo-ligase [Armatimonadetes bacterium CG_4_8_14_3_um_filter_58_9]PJB62983.1 MAG: 5-formyltetrahydrofolate cyclo-ligase [Armatimonadetes bacterium CG_4_9_14_3_um_filter_58_7]